MKNTVEYKLISKHYGNQVTKRSQVPLINHINEGLTVLDDIRASDAAKRAFCLHPLFQANADLIENYYMAQFVEPHVLLLTMEYRNIANAFLSDKMDSPNPQWIYLSPLNEVNQMLVADKVQNYKDFVTYHKGTHKRSDKLEMYFKQWLDRLGIETSDYSRLCTLIDMGKL